MEQLTESNSVNSIQPSVSTTSRSILTIDLNQIPSPPETLQQPPSPPTPSSPSSTTFYNLPLSPTSLVRTIHDHPPLPDGSAAEIPNGDSFCARCGGDSVIDRLVCDGCERGFHFMCGGSTPLSEDWVCGDCLRNGVSSRRWRLGKKTKEDSTGCGDSRLIDINGSPPSDGDSDAAILVGSRKTCSQDNAYIGYASGGLLSKPNLFGSVNGYGFRIAPTIVAHTVKLDFQDILHNSQSAVRTFEDIGHGSQLGKIRSSNTAFRLPALNPSDVLKSLKEFVSERHGVLQEGWQVQFRQSKNGYETYAVYCAPDGKVFETMSDVASYLGLESNGNLMELDLRSEDASAVPKNGLHLPKRRKLMKLPVGNGFMENKDSLTNSFSNGYASNSQNEQFFVSKGGKNSLVVDAIQGAKLATDTHQFNEGLPLQYEDFFVLSLGKVDSRSLYHCTNQISPVGYRSCWHDKITGSLFLCNVLDGGESGPVFKVRRFSCSALPIPYGSTILQRSCAQLEVPHIEGDKVATLDEECSIEAILSDPCCPVEGDSLSWLLRNSSAVDGQEANQREPLNSSPVGEQFSEFSVDGKSSSFVWNNVSQKISDACRQIFKQSGSLKFYCKHAKEGMSSFNDILNNNSKDSFSSLDKFCSLLGTPMVPSVVKNVDELDSAVDALKRWLDSDRFGLDVEFVQELIEQCPGVYRCSQYESLKRRNLLQAPLVRNGLLLINGKTIEQCQQDSVLDSLYKEYRSTWKPAREHQSRPPGKHLGVNLPPHLVGDVVQVWELLHRFHGVLSMEPMNFDELEAELLRPWFESLYAPGFCDEDSAATSADGFPSLGEQTLSSSDDIDHPKENQSIEVQITGLREEAQDSSAQSIGLRRAHMSLLDVLVSELHIKVAAMVDPSIDGESKSRRGRRKDVDTSILAIRTKLNLLPINELTWPELARRYVLALLSMDGNLDSTEAGTRECGKVFRCLQGDGGVLCGSLVGVAGIEADALLLAEATKRIFGNQSSYNDHLTIEEDDLQPVSNSGMIGADGSIPEWAQVLEPVRKLPTNVGTRIRKCVYEALEKDPPDWARKKLEHSISKEIYKGNASGPTKKAVLSVLADVLSEASQQKVCKEIKKKTVVSISDIIMRQCRILLRRAASADGEKVFCNLLGRNLLNFSENDEEGLLGSPAMVARPLDFRTVDLRLAVGVYNGSHEAFLEDVRELWKNISIAHADQPELVQLAEKLSQNFESLYLEEVVALADKLKEYSEMEQLSREAKTEILDVIASTSDIPKAPWDEGVCKVCGIDKDDVSVLLCDTCDAEYHTYCLDPPLARIPEGNWYCPSCVSGVNVLASSSKGLHLIRQRHRRKYLGEGVRTFLEELARLSAVMEQKDYWEFGVDEKILLLKFLCDEALNSIIIRQHLEQCFEASSDLQQKLRTLYSEWKSLKIREDVLVVKAAKVGPGISNVVRDPSLNGHLSKAANTVICEVLQPPVSERCDINSSISGSSPTIVTNHVEKYVPSNSHDRQAVDLDFQMEDIGKVVKEDSPAVDLHERSCKRQKSFVSNECSVSNPLVQETSGVDSEASSYGKMDEHGELDVSAKCKSEEGVTGSTSPLNGGEAEGSFGSTSCELQALTDELMAVRKEMAAHQQSIASAESHLQKSSVRMDYLGSDSSGRLYWVAPQMGLQPRVIVDCTMSLQRNKKGFSHVSMFREGSSTACPFVYGSDCLHPTSTQWVYYQSDTEVRELLKSLNDHDPKERALRDSIMHSQKLRFQEIHRTGTQNQAPVEESAYAGRTEKAYLVTKASAVLERKYGPFFPAESIENVKRRSRRSKGANDEKMYRCKCLEPIWHSRNHCFACHRTFHTVDELDNHNDGKCLSSFPVSGKAKPSAEPSSGLVKISEKEQQITLATDKVQAKKTSAPKLSRLINFQSDSLCPYRFEEISSKFVTNDSIKELVCEIGLIRSEGIPSFVPSQSPYLSDPSLVIKQGIAFAVDQLKIPEMAVGHFNQVIGTGTNFIEKAADNNSLNFSRHKHDENSKSGQPIPGIKGDGSKKFHPISFASPMAVDAYCTVREYSLKPVVGRSARILGQLKICLLDIEAALLEEALRPLKSYSSKRTAWRSFVKAANSIFEMIQATIVLEDMIKTDYLKNEWWYWSSLSAAAKTSTLSSLALRIFALDDAIVYDRVVPDVAQAGSLKPSDDVDQQSPANIETSEKTKQGRRFSKRRRDAEA